MQSRPSVLVAAPRIPEPDRESGSRRTFDAVGFFLEAGCRVTVASRDTEGDPECEDRLKALGVEVLGGFGESALRRLAEGDFVLAWIAFWEAAERLIPDIRRLSPATRIVVDSVDLHLLRRCREGFLTGGEGEERRFLDVDFGIDAARELNVYAAADAVLAVSEKEAALLEDLLGGATTALCWPDCEDLPRSRTLFRQRRGALFVGSFLHPPNRDGVRWLCREALPLVGARLLERHPLTLVGHGADSEVENWIRGTPGAQLVGWAPSLRPYWERSRIAVVPLRFGAGTKRKLIQSAMVGLPAVSTSVGVEGLGLQDGREVLVADTPEDFAAAIGKLLGDPGLWESLARRGRRKMLRGHGRERVRREFGEVLERCLGMTPKRVAGAPPNWMDLWMLRSYRVLLERVRTAVEALAPEGAIVAVVSRGDDQLLRLGNREGWHFPRGDDGMYAGHHPPDDAWATDHLRRMVQNGADFLVFPASSLWWIGHYRGFAQFLQKHCRLCFDQPETGRIYGLDGLRRTPAEKEMVD